MDSSPASSEHDRRTYRAGHDRTERRRSTPEDSTVHRRRQHDRGDDGRRRHSSQPAITAVGSLAALDRRGRRSRRRGYGCGPGDVGRSLLRYRRALSCRPGTAVGERRLSDGLDAPRGDYRGGDVLHAAGPSWCRCWCGAGRHPGSDRRAAGCCVHVRVTQPRGGGVALPPTGVVTCRSMQGRRPHPLQQPARDRRPGRDPYLGSRAETRARMERWCG